MSAPIKTSYDRTIVAMAAEGATSSEIAAAMGKTYSQVTNRAMHLGVWRALVANNQARRAARRAAQLSEGPRHPTGNRSAIAETMAANGRVDRTATDLLHTLRAVRRLAAPSAPVPGSIIARVFEAGLTLDDIDAELGVPPADAVAAIRHHLSGDGGVTLGVR